MAYKINIAGCQQISFTTSGATATSNAIGAKSVVLYATADCFVNIGATAGTTGAANLFVPASTFLELEVMTPQSTMQARGGTAAGILYINTLVA